MHNKINVVLFDKLRLQWEIKFHAAKAIYAENEIVKMQSGEIDEPIIRFEEINKELLKQQIEEIEDTARRLLEEERYEEMDDLIDTYWRLKSKYDRL